RTSAARKHRHRRRDTTSESPTADSGASAARHGATSRGAAASPSSIELEPVRVHESREPCAAAIRMDRDHAARAGERERAALKLPALRAHLSIARGRELALDLDALDASLLVRVERRFGVRVDDLGAGE